jgi:hypothetical protein
MGKSKRRKVPGQHTGEHEQGRDVERETTGGGPGERSDREAIGRPVRLEENDREDASASERPDGSDRA